jgi:hypothetical protein
MSGDPFGAAAFAQLPDGWWGVHAARRPTVPAIFLLISIAALL